MKTFLTVAVVAGVAVSLCGALVVLAAPPAADAVVSPQVHADRRVTFRVYAPKASDVSMSGDWMAPGAKQAMTREEGDSGVWSVTVGPLEAGAAIYTFNVDGMTIADPVNPRVKLRWRTSASLVDVPGDGAELWEQRDVPHGTVEQFWHAAKTLAGGGGGGGTRAAWIYTPPEYAHDPAGRYPVLYLLHGHNDTAAGWSMVGGANFILDNLIAQKKAVPMIIVMPYGHAVPYTAPREQQGKNTALMESYLIEDLMPAIEKEYRVASGRENCAIVGLSMGGGHALQIGLDHLDRFSAIGAFSSAMPSDLEKRLRGDEGKLLNSKLALLWIGCGRDDPAFARWQKIHEVLEELKIRHVFRPSEGAHTYAVWRKYLGEVAPLLFQPAATR
jgi:enterochelin esterase family protein